MWSSRAIFPDVTALHHLGEFVVMITPTVPNSGLHGCADPGSLHNASQIQHHLRRRHQLGPEYSFEPKDICVDRATMTSLSQPSFLCHSQRVTMSCFVFSGHPAPTDRSESTTVVLTTHFVHPRPASATLQYGRVGFHGDDEWE